MPRWDDAPTGDAVLAPRTIVRGGLCIGCGSCAAAPDGADREVRPEMVFDRFGLLRPEGSSAWERQPTAEFAAICPFSPSAVDEDVLAAELFADATAHHPATGPFEAAYVGHVAEEGFRAEGSSGGMVTWVLAELLRRGIVDAAAHVAPVAEPGGASFFRYRIARSGEEVRAGAKSRYYPVELSGVLDEIRATPGRYAVVGVPCFIKAVQLRRRHDPVLRERIVVTLGLFCGHMKSARFVESFAWQMDTEVAAVQAVEFRRKDVTRPASTYTAELQLGDGSRRRRDWWNLVDGDWGAGFFQSSACNFCDDVTAETADVSFGDAWVEPYSSDGRGTNVVVVRSALVGEAIDRAIGDGRLCLEPVDGTFVERTQAAGLRQRREGLAYRLSWRRRGVRARKRVTPSTRLSARRKLIYRSRYAVSWWSHRLFWLARRTRRPQVYLRWARAAQTVYHAVAYSRGRLGEVVDRWFPAP